MGARRAAHRRRTVGIAIAIAAVAMLVPALALAHIERASYWPDPGARHLGQAGRRRLRSRRAQALQRRSKKKKPGKTRVVCPTVPSKKLRKHGTAKQLSKNKSIKALNKDLKKARKKGYKLRESQPAIKLKKKKAKKLRKFNLKLLRQCKYKSIQDAVTASHNNDRVEIMPGLYTEPKSRAKPTNDPACDQYKITNDKNQAGAVSYAYQFHCPNDQNLIAVLGRSADQHPGPAAAAARPPRHPRRRGRASAATCRSRAPASRLTTSRSTPATPPPATARRSARSRTSASAPTAPTASSSTTSRSVTPRSTTST